MGVTIDGVLRLKSSVGTCRKRMTAKSKLQLAPGYPLRIEPLRLTKATIGSQVYYDTDEWPEEYGDLKIPRGALGPESGSSNSLSITGIGNMTEDQQANVAKSSLQLGRIVAGAR